MFNSTLINGKGRYPGGPQDVPLAIVNVIHGKRSVPGLAIELTTGLLITVITVIGSASSPSLASPASFSPLMAIQ